MCACACTCYVHCNYASMHVCMYVGVGGQMGCGRGGGGGLLGGGVCVCVEGVRAWLTLTVSCPAEWIDSPALRSRQWTWQCGGTAAGPGS